jgi:hypothetical protein
LSRDAGEFEIEERSYRVSREIKRVSKIGASAVGERHFPIARHSSQFKKHKTFRRIVRIPF